MTFGTPIYKSYINTNYLTNLYNNNQPSTLNYSTIANCLIYLSTIKSFRTVYKSNRGGYQSPSNLFNFISENKDIFNNDECLTQIGILYREINTQISLWYLSLKSNNVSLIGHAVGSLSGIIAGLIWNKISPFNINYPN